MHPPKHAMRKSVGACTLQPREFRGGMSAKTKSYKSQLLLARVKRNCTLFVFASEGVGNGQEEIPVEETIAVNIPLPRLLLLLPPSR